MRVFSYIAGAAALLAAVGRFVLGAPDLAMLGSEPIATIVWHAMTYAMALVGVSVIASARASREVAVTFAMFGTAFFGGIAAIMAVTAGMRLGDPFAYYPVFVVTGVAALHALAAARA